MIQRLAGFTGPAALAVKITVMAVLNALLVWMLMAAIGKSSTGLAVGIALMLIAVNAVYFSKRAVPMKFLLPGTIFLLAFVVTPVATTLYMSVFNYQTGNEISKSAAIEGIISNGIAADPNEEATYYVTMGEANGELAALVTRDLDQQVWLGTADGVQELVAGSYTLGPDNTATAARGFEPLTDDALVSRGDEIAALRIPFEGDSFLTPELPYAVKQIQSLVYDEASDTFRDTVTGDVYIDNGNGNFALESDPNTKLDPGWRAFNGFFNYTSLLQDPTIRGPFISVAIWTFAFAFISVLSMFAFGLLLAIALDKPFRGRTVYRSILILPYAIPSFMSILIWNGLFNTNFGAVNVLLGQQIDWYNDPWLARFVVILVNLWLGIPYFYLISSGALQSIPAELEEAAAIDGATSKQAFRQIKLPLLLQVLSPLLIASFAFNFNNFNIVFLLTGGGPTDVLSGEVAGATDLLITYTYKTAIGYQYQNFGLASAISTLVFLIVGALSLWSLRRSKLVEIER